MCNVEDSRARRNLQRRNYVGTCGAPLGSKQASLSLLQHTACMHATIDHSALALYCRAAEFACSEFGISKTQSELGSTEAAW